MKAHLVNLVEFEEGCGYGIYKQVLFHTKKEALEYCDTYNKRKSSCVDELHSITAKYQGEIETDEETFNASQED